MAVFDKSTKIGRRVADPITDDTLPSSGSLSWGSITSDAALAGTTGVDCKLVHGDRWQQIDGNLTENINKDVRTTILCNHNHTVIQNQTNSITGNQNETVTGNRTGTITGSENQTNIGTRNCVQVAPVSRLNSAPDQQQEPTTKIRILGIEFTQQQNQYVYTTAICEIYIIKSETWAVKSEQGGLTNGVKVIDLAGGGLTFDTKLIQLETKALKAHTFGATADVGAVKGRLAPGAGLPPHPPLTGAS
ncbi:MAG: hypothetical protein AB1714_15660 [Acidobacteriota bacterium]